MTQNQKQWGQRIGEFDIFWTIHHGVYIRKKIPIRKFKRQRTNLRKVFATHIRHQGLMSLIFKELLSYLERNSLQKITKHLQNWNENDLQHRKEMFRLPHRKRTASLTCMRCVSHLLDTKNLKVDSILAWWVYGAKTHTHTFSVKADLCGGVFGSIWPN